MGRVSIKTKNAKSHTVCLHARSCNLRDLTVKKRTCGAPIYRPHDCTCKREYVPLSDKLYKLIEKEVQQQQESYATEESSDEESDEAGSSSLVVENVEDDHEPSMDIVIDKSNMIHTFKIAIQYKIRELKKQVMGFSSKIPVNCDWPRKFIETRDDFLRKRNADDDNATTTKRVKIETVEDDDE